MSLLPWTTTDSLFNWPTTDLWELMPASFKDTTKTLSSLGAVDVTETPTEYCIVADTPGMTNNDVKVEVKNNCIIMSGERKEEHREEKKDKKYFRMERTQTSFSRSFRLPENCDATKVKANCVNGVLKITMPKKTTTEATTSSVAVTAHQ